MPINSRNKGAHFEREIAKMIYDELGVTVKRNLDQYQAAGNYDLTGLDGFALECKRYKTATIAERKVWWKQAVAQAKGEEIPVLIYNADRQPVRVVVHPFTEYFDLDEFTGTMDISFELWAAMVRETL